MFTSTLSVNVEKHDRCFRIYRIFEKASFRNLGRIDVPTMFLFIVRDLARTDSSEPSVQV